MYIDIHTHLTDRRLCDKTEEILTECQRLGVEIIVDTGHSPKTSFKAYENSKKYENVFCVLGVHPEKPQAFNTEFIDFLRKSAVNPKCIAIGEIGLDYHYNGYDLDLQKKVFVKQLEIADELDLPIVIHSRDASADMLRILTENKHYLKNGFLMHCYSESLEQAKNYLNLGGYFSFGGVITFRNWQKSDMIRRLPLDRILAETDAPYLTPDPFRGRTNYPQYVVYVYEKLAEIYNLRVDSIATRLQENATRLFGKLKQTRND